ncbi:MAG: hypothetical protein ACYSUK_01045 [Planctomycetota bacterium]|jgi:hypothetical protein
MNELHKSVFSKLFAVVIFGIALAYFEAAIVVYLRAIFYPEGFKFPLSLLDLNVSHRHLLLTEIGREAASIILIATAAWLFGRNKRQRLAYFLIIFGIWDIFYYVWLNVLLNWPASIMDWDILFLIPAAWASPVLAPVIISILFLIFAGMILYRDYNDRLIKTIMIDWVGFWAGAVIVTISFCIAGRYINEPDYAGHFSWLLFGLGCLVAIAAFVKCFMQSGKGGNCFQ